MTKPVRRFLAAAALVLAGASPLVGNSPIVNADAAEGSTATSTLAGQLTLGGSFTCAIASAKVFCWGANHSGQAGQASGASVKSPAEVAGTDGALQVAAGQSHACALITGGSVKCWGQNFNLQLGRSTTGNFSYEALVVVGITNAIGVAAGLTHSCALISGGSAKCWGSNSGGQLGTGVFADVNYASPQTVTTLSDGARIIANGDRTCVLTTTGGVKCWGRASETTMGAGTMGTGAVEFPAPISVVREDDLSPLSGLTSVSLSSSVFSAGGSACGLGGDGTAWCWGNDAYSQIGTGQHSAIRGAVQFKAPNATQPLSDIQQISVGDDYTCMVRTGGIPYCIGNNMGGQLGDGTNLYNEMEPVLQKVAEISRTSVVVASSSHTCSIDADTMTYCWGTGNAGQIGNGKLENSYTPSTVQGAAPQSISFGSLTDRAIDAGDLSLSANSSSGKDVSFDSSTPTVCTVAGSTVKTIAVGTCTLKASRGSYGLFAVATDVSRSFEVTGVKPVVATGAATPTSSKATLTGSVNSGGVDASVTFTYGTDATLASGTKSTTAVTKKNVAAEDISVEVTGLTGNSTYYYRVEATNSIGSAKGDIKTFTTKGSKPTAKTGTATPSATKATLNATINPNDVETSIKFEYGTASDLKGASTASATSRTGSEDIDVSVVVSDLAERTTYYYRVIATNIVGTTIGDIKSFSTSRPEGVSINDGDEFTNSQQVTISVVGTSSATKAILSNDGGFKVSETVDLVSGAAEVPWKLQSSKEGTFTKIVYVRFVSRLGTTLSTQSDDIILDTTKPVMTSALASSAPPSGSAVAVARAGIIAKKAGGGVKLSLRGSDTVAGIGVVEVRSAANKASTRIEIKSVGGKADGKPRPMSQSISLKTTAKRLQVRVLDRAGNSSVWRSITVS